MSYIYCHGVSRKQLVEQLLSAAHGHTVTHVLKGNTLWTIKQTGRSAPAIVCFLITQEPGPIWGYQALRESLGTPSSCPIEFLGMVAEVDSAWRKSVRRYHERHSKSPVVGEIWALKRAKIPHVTITQTAPRLVGTYANKAYALSVSKLLKPIGVAHDPRPAAANTVRP